MKKLELLAPARNCEIAWAAINQGADAVYIGAPAFGARKAASNNLSDIEKLCNYAHLFNAKVYITLNTLLFDDELEEVEQLIHQIYNLGADALVIQDLGILEMNLPPIPLHASTQMHNFSTEKILFLEKAGFQRVVLARELSINQIQEIKSQTSIELEAFIHGALCVSMSGQCYVSHAVTGRSGNRGECAQICRSSFKLTDSVGNVFQKNKHLLSLKDLNLSHEIPALALAGVNSFKIEGRLKDITYVKNNVAHYRKILDKFITENTQFKHTSDGIVSCSFNPDPERSYTRGFTNYFITNRNKSLSSYSSQKSLGKFLGKVSQIGANYFVLNTNTKLVAGDGICFLNKDGILSGMLVNRVETNKLYPNDMKGISCNMEVFRNFDKQFYEQLSQEEKSRRIPVKLSFTEAENGYKLSIKNCNGTFANEEFYEKTPIAENKEKAIQNIKSQLTKFGNSIYEVNEIDINLNTVPFISASKLNNLRRIVCEKLDIERIKAYQRTKIQIVPNNIQYPDNELDYRGNITNKNAQQFYERHGVKVQEQGFELLVKEEAAKKTLMFSRYCVKHELNACPKIAGGKKLPGTLFLSDDTNKYRLEFDCNSCIMKVFLAGKIK